MATAAFQAKTDSSYNKYSNNKKRRGQGFLSAVERRGGWRRGGGGGGVAGAHFGPAPSWLYRRFSHPADPFLEQPIKR